MYTDFYGLKERPFALVPDPRYLFLSRGHREALAHLLYGIEAGEGFIEIVGQVGTGKTTLCRTLVGRIGSDVEIAYIFNPSPSASELLAAINREFGLPNAVRGMDVVEILTREDGDRRDLIDDLNRFLLEKKAEGRRVLLVIDEAQNLEPRVLEQIRLISNLETEREKLIQIVLMGQPELEENLARSDLRQLRQRITVCWRLRPFGRGEVGEYVNHRLRVAGLENPKVFSAGAMQALYHASRGIPRVINAIADRALLAGYSAGEVPIRARTIRKVARELPVSERGGARGVLGLTPVAAGALAVCGLVVGSVAAAWWPRALPGRIDPPAVSAGPEPLAANEPAPEASFIQAADSELVGADPVELEGVGAYLLERGPDATAAAALDALLDLWGHEEPVASAVDPNLFASAVREVSPLKVFVTRADVEQLVHLNLPAVLELEPAPEQRRYAALLHIAPDGAAELGLRDQVFTVDPGQLERMWTGRAFFLWSNFESMPALGPGMNGSAVRWLQARLTELGYLQRGDASGSFDGFTVAAIRRFQAEHGLDDTGRVGPETLIALYQRLRYEAPRLLVEDELS